jgi:hypothetical protein
MAEMNIGHEALLFFKTVPACVILVIIHDGVVKTLHLRRCSKISIITTYSSTPK